MAALRARVFSRHFHAPPAGALFVRPPSAPAEAPLIRGGVSHGVPGALLIRPPCEPIEAPVIGSEISYEAPGADEGSGSMELMAVPKHKISTYRRKLRNMPKRLKPVSVIAQCSYCGRYRLPHFFCCSETFRAKKNFKY